MRRSIQGSRIYPAKSENCTLADHMAKPTQKSVLEFPSSPTYNADCENEQTCTRRPSDPEAVERILKRTRLLLALNQFHKEEDKATYREFYRRKAKSQEQLHDDSECFANCTRTDREAFKLTPRTRNLAYEYRFDPSQVLKSLPERVLIRDDQTLSHEELYGEVILDESDIESGLITLKCKDAPPRTVHLITSIFISSRPIQLALEDVTKELLEGNLTPHGAIADFLAHRKPRIEGHNGESLIGDNESPTTAAVNAVINLQDSALIIQGPPGCGKTYTAAHIISAMMREGRRVAVSSNSHAAIRNLMLAAQSHCTEAEVHARFVAATTGKNEKEDQLELCSNAGLSRMLEDSVVVGATAWGFSRTDLIDAFDLLIIDEASQMSLATLVAISRVARNLIVIGDQQQLGQPIKGRHTDNGGVSALDFRLVNSPTVRPEHGIFLATTHRLHPSICHVISEHMYADRLSAAPTTALRELQTPTAESKGSHIPAGIIHIPIEHQGNTQFSVEEVDAAEQIYEKLVGTYRNEGQGIQRQLNPDDILFVTPYNAQVSKLKYRLGSNARVGTVDKFQGQQAAIVVVSLCASDPNTAARGLSFVLDANRLNVAVSRAETLCIILCNPALLNTPIPDMEDARRVRFLHALCENKSTLQKTVRSTRTEIIEINRMTG